MTEDEILQRITEGFIPTEDVVKLAVFSIMAAQEAYERGAEPDHCGCPVCLMYETVEDLGLLTDSIPPTH